jgi:glycosyltransferase involved in cell wall biosynthesis
MKILTFSNCELVDSQGSGYVIVNFARGLESRGHRVTLMGPDVLITGPGRGRGRHLKLCLGLWWKAEHLVNKIRPDIVEFYGGEAWLAADRLARKPDRQFRIVAHSNGIEPLVEETLARHDIHNTLDGRPRKWFQGLLHFPVEKAFYRADALVTVSQPEADYAVRRGFQRKDRVLAIDNALHDEFLGRPFLAFRPNVIGFCGSWLARKGVKLLVSDLSHLLREFTEWKLHLVGVGEQFDTMAHFPADILPRIQVTGFVKDKAELHAIYQSWAIAVLPSIYESFGLVAAEAMACGAALVANRTGFAASLHDGEEAMLISQPCSPQLYQAVKTLIENPSLRQRIAYAGWERVQRLTWTDSVSQLEKFYLKLLDQFAIPGSKGSALRKGPRLNPHALKLG